MRLFDPIVGVPVISISTPTAESTRVLLATGTTPPRIRKPTYVKNTKLIGLVLILLIAGSLRGYRLGFLSFWYDEVVSMTLAREPGFREVLSKLDVIDATRAPLHPLLLHRWVRLFGPSETSGRAFSMVCGILTVALIHRIARRSFDSPATGLFACWLAAMSPMLIVYSREARMYAWLVLVTCAAWDALLSLRRVSRETEGDTPTPRHGSGTPRRIWYAVCLIALGYSHPLGLLMAAALGLASFLNAKWLGFSIGSWLITHLLAATFVAAWVGRYVDHAPELVMGRLPIRFLLGTPIGWIGGNFLTLPVCLLVVCAGLFRFRGPSIVPKKRSTLVFDHPALAVSFLAWLIVPVMLLWIYSRVSQPIFGPARYTLYSAPAYLILMARGMARLPRWAGCALALGATALAFSTLPSLVYAPDLKADWRGTAIELGHMDPSGIEPVLVVSNDPRQNLEVVTARYYLGKTRKAIALPAPLIDLDKIRRSVPPPSRFWLAIGVKDGWLTSEIPDRIPLRRSTQVLDRNGLRLIAVDPADLPSLRP